MSRLIDADALIADLDKGLWGKDWDKVLAEAIINEAPSIDIVRCKECKHWEMRNSPRGWCEVHQGYVSPNYYCADGERREP